MERSCSVSSAPPLGRDAPPAAHETYGVAGGWSPKAEDLQIPAGSWIQPERKLAAFLPSSVLPRMRLGFIVSGWVVGTLLLGACGEAKQSAPRPDADGASGDGGTGGSAVAEPGTSGFFEPLPRAQPTESGDWVVDPDDPLTLYALGRRSMRSRDGGHSWAELDWPEGALSLGFSRSPVPTLLLRAQRAGEGPADKLFESLDDGESWEDTGALLSFADTIVVIDRDDGPVLLTWRGNELVRSTDKGATWSPTELVPEPELAFTRVGRVVVSSEATPVVYIEAMVFGERYEPGVFVSTDGAKTFVLKSVPGEEGPRLSVDCQGHLYVSSGGAVFRSSDEGSSWENVAELEPESRYFEVLRGVPSACGETVYATGDVSTDFTLWQLDGATVTSQPLPDYGRALDLGDDRLLLLSELGLRRRSDDGGRTWWTAGVNLGNGDLVVSPTGAGALFVSTVGGVYHSDDDGKTWQGAPRSGVSPQDMYADSRDVNLLYARSVFGGDSPWSFVSTDRGLSFRDWPVPSVAAPEMPEAFASTAAGELTVVTRHGVYRTNDGGDHFTRLLTLPKSQQVGWAAIGAGPTPSIYAHVFDDEATAASPVVASLDGGRTWAWSDAGLYITNLVVAPSRPEVVLARPGASGEEGLVRSMDGGVSWERLIVPGERSVSAHFDPQPPHALYAVGERLHRSLDYGDTWEPITEMPTDSWELELDPNAGGARYALDTRGLLYKMTE
jgi:photosystem II stability/assembly factor-like uncharacterized protein